MRRVWSRHVWRATASARAAAPSARASSVVRRAGARGPRARASGVARLDEPRGLAVAQHLADLVEVRGHDPASHRHVLEQLGRRAEERRAVGVAHVGRGEHVAGREVRRALVLRHGARQHGELRHAVAGEVRPHLRHREAVADHEQSHRLPPLGPALEQPAERLGEHLGPVPAAEGADEADARASPRARAAGGRRVAVDGRRVAVGVDAVRVDEDALRRRSPGRRARRESAG